MNKVIKWFLLFWLFVFIVGGITFGCGVKVEEGLVDMGTTWTSHTVDLPLNTRYSCQNVCGPLARCSITGEQCTSDVDCAGCQPKLFLTRGSQVDVHGENDAGILTTSQTPTFSVLTTDIGTRADLYSKGIKDDDSKTRDPPSYFRGVDKWTDTFKAGMELYDRRYNPSVGTLPFLPKYPTRKTLSGEFSDDGPLAANAELSFQS
jgi:hypothetical protein